MNSVFLEISLVLVLLVANGVFAMTESGGDDFQTVSGWFMNELGRVPAETDRLTAGEWTFEVLDMDSTGVDKVLATWNPKSAAEESVRGDVR